MQSLKNQYIEGYCRIRNLIFVVLDEGRVRDGNFISDGEKAFTDEVYDILGELAGDGILGFLYDTIAPSAYDRDAY